MNPLVKFGIWVSPRRDWLRHDGRPVEFDYIDDARRALDAAGLVESPDPATFKGAYVATAPEVSS